MIVRSALVATLALTQVSPSTGRVVGKVTLTMATSGKSTARAYDSRSVAPRAKPLPESRNVIVFFEGIEASGDLAATKAT